MSITSVRSIPHQHVNEPRKPPAPVVPFTITCDVQHVELHLAFIQSLIYYIHVQLKHSHNINKVGKRVARDENKIKTAFIGSSKSTMNSKSSSQL